MESKSKLFIVGSLIMFSFLCGCIHQVGVSNDTVVLTGDHLNVAVEGRIISIEASNSTVVITTLDVKQIKIHGDNNTVCYSGLIKPNIFDYGNGTTFKTY